MTEEASLVVQWLRICLALQGTWVQSLVWEDSTCHKATKPVQPQVRKPMCLEPMHHKKSHRNRSPCTTATEPVL